MVLIAGLLPHLGPQHERVLIATTASQLQITAPTTTIIKFHETATVILNYSVSHVTLGYWEHASAARSNLLFEDRNQ